MTSNHKNTILKLADPDTLAIIAGIKDFLEKRGVRGYIVGGFVRDALLSKRSEDIDIAVSAGAPDIAREFAANIGGSFVLLDDAEQIARVVTRTEPCRQIDFSTIEESIGQDLGRRDFTIDAMAVDLDDFSRDKTGAVIIDPFGGLNDIRAKTIKAVYNQAFADDPLRLLRALRLSAELGFRIDKETENLIRRDSRLISATAGERVREELLKIMAAPAAGGFLQYMDELELIDALIPELAAARGVQQPPEHQWDVFSHTLKTVDAVDFVLQQGDWPYADKSVQGFIPWSADIEAYFGKRVSGGSNRRLLLKLAALLHDIAKPQTKTIDETGRTRFLGHARAGAETAAAILERLRFSTREIELVRGIVRHHLRPVQTGNRDALPTARAIYRYFRDAGDAAIDTLFFSLADHLAARGTTLDVEHFRQHCFLVNYVLEQHFKQQSIIAPPRLITGIDIMRELGLSPGRRVGELLEALREAQAAGEVSNKEEAMRYVKNIP